MRFVNRALGPHIGRQVRRHLPGEKPIRSAFDRHTSTTRQLPSTHLTLELLTGAKPVDLKRGEADLAIRSGPVTDQELIARPLGESGWSLYAAPSYPARRP
jgi:DNA-binding transcriptional LysR family regulator